MQASGHLLRYAAGDGNDTVYGFNESDTLTIAGDAYSTKKSGDNVVVTVGDGKISLIGAAGKNLNINKADRTGIITLTKDNDIFRNNFANVTLNAGLGDDSVVNYASGITLNGEGGNDTVVNNGSNATISGDDGDDYLSNANNSNASLFGGAGNDYINNNRGNSATLGGGNGHDSVYNYVGNNASIDGGAGNDSVYSYFSSNATINGGSGNDSIDNVYGDSALIDGGSGADFIFNDKSNSVTISGGDDNDSITNSGANVSVGGGKGIDSVSNSGDSVTIDGGDENDSITNSGKSVTIDGGTGNDSVSNTGKAVTINGGDGKDFVSNSGSNVSINGGAGNDSVSNSGSNVTITGGKGNDTVYGNRSTGVSYKYANANGDGKDVIYGFNATSTLFISGRSWSTVQSGNDIVVNVGGGNVTLKDAANLSKVNILTDTIPGYWTVKGTTANYYSYDTNKKLLSVGGLVKGLEAVNGKIDGIELNGVTVTLSENVLDKKRVTISDGYIVALVDDVSVPVTGAGKWLVKGTAALYKVDISAGYTCNGKEIAYAQAKTGKTLT